MADNHYVCVHTLAGGERDIALRDGKVVAVQLPPRSTEILDAETGALVLPATAKPPAARLESQETPRNAD